MKYIISIIIALYSFTAQASYDVKAGQAAAYFAMCDKVEQAGVTIGFIEEDSNIFQDAFELLVAYHDESDGFRMSYYKNHAKAGDLLTQDKLDVCARLYKQAALIKKSYTKLIYN